VKSPGENLKEVNEIIKGVGERCVLEHNLGSGGQVYEFGTDLFRKLDTKTVRNNNIYSDL